jgi:hypothetical protein
MADVGDAWLRFDRLGSWYRSWLSQMRPVAPVESPLWRRFCDELVFGNIFLFQPWVGAAMESYTLSGSLSRQQHCFQIVKAMVLV